MPEETTISKCEREHLTTYSSSRFLYYKMAPNDKKRSRPIPTSSQRSKKRQRTEHATPAVEKRPVKLDGLLWNAVQLPDMFEDAEGFFGLEEIEGVDIVREGDTVKFVRFTSMS
jgi:ATP-dependent RNA helicase DDX24/MAK5